MAGRKLGSYRLVRLLSRTDVAEVYLAINEGRSDIPRRVALKRILPTSEDFDRLTRLFQEEARISESLRHPSVVRVWTHEEVEDIHFLVMDYVDGPDLGRFLHAARKADHALDPRVVCFIGVQAASALAAVHGAPGPRGAKLDLTHGHVSPDNLLISPDGSVRLCDFAVARTNDRLGELSGTFRGKSAYMSPEQVRREPIGPSSDLFSLGVVLFELATGVNPFASDSDRVTLRTIASGTTPDPLDYRPDLPIKLAGLIQRCLARSTEFRPQSAQNIAEELATIGSTFGELSDGAGQTLSAGPLIATLKLLFSTQMKRRQMDGATRSQRTGASPATDSPAPTADSGLPTIPASTTVPSPSISQGPADASRPSPPVSDEPPDLAYSPLKTMELGQWSTESNEHMALTTAEFDLALSDPRRVRLIGRPEVVPPLSTDELRVADDLTPSAADLPEGLASIAEEDPTALPQDDPFRLGSLVDDDPALPAAAPVDAELKDEPSLSSFATWTERSELQETLTSYERVIRPNPEPPEPGRPLWWISALAFALLLIGVVVIGGPSPQFASDVDVPIAAPAKQAEDMRPGTLVIDSQPWAYVSVNGVLREWVTPTSVELPPGEHNIGFLHPDSGWRTERKVTIKAGEELRLSVNR